MHTGKREKKNGSSLVIVVCVAAFLLAFSLAMIYAAGLMLSGANRRLEQEKSYQLAKSFAQLLEEELYETDVDAAPANGFYCFLCKFLEDTRYLPYNPDHPESTIYYYSAGNAPAGEEYGNLTIALYKEELSANSLSDDFLYDTSGSGADSFDPSDIENQIISRYAVTLEIISGEGENEYHHKIEYEPEVTYKNVTYRHNSTVIIWNSEQHRWYRNSTTPYEEEGILTIRYEFKPGFENLKTCTFKKAAEKDSAPSGGDTEGGAP